MKAVLSEFLDAPFKLIADSTKVILAGRVTSIVPLPSCLTPFFE